METNQQRIRALNAGEMLSHCDWVTLLSSWTEEDRAFAGTLARAQAERRFGRDVFFRGIIEFTNICKNDCFYCGIRRSNASVVRYRLTPEEILSCCTEGYRLGYRTFVLQGGEDSYWNDARMSDVVQRIRRAFPDCAITLSLGERSRASYQRLFDAGANRYLLRHETADAAHYQRLHPVSMSLAHRVQCLRELKEIGFQVGCGMMVGSPGQTPETLAQDMELLGTLRPHMVGMGPFLPHPDTPFCGEPAGSAALTLFLLSLTRLLLPDVLLPATTALETVCSDGRKLGVLAGCNVVMPNLSPLSVRKQYLLYENKAGMTSDAEQGIRELQAQMREIGYRVAVARGDFGQVREQTGGCYGNE